MKRYKLESKIRSVSFKVTFSARFREEFNATVSSVISQCLDDNVFSKTEISSLRYLFRTSSNKLKYKWGLSLEFGNKDEFLHSSWSFQSIGKSFIPSQWIFSSFHFFCSIPLFGTPSQLSIYQRVTIWSHILVKNFLQRLTKKIVCKHRMY